MDFQGASADPNPLPDPDAETSPVELMDVPSPEDADDATGERTAPDGSLPTDLYPTSSPDQPDSIPDAEHVVVDRVNYLNLEDAEETAGAETLGSNGSTPTDFHQQLNPDDSEPAQVENMSALNFEVHGNASGAERHSVTDTEIEVADEGSTVAGNMVGTSSFGGRDAWREGSEQDLDVPPSPSSSGYAGERGSSGGVSSGIAETDDPGTLLDDWSRKRHLDEDDGSISWIKRKKHYFLLSHSGKPIFTRYGDVHKLAGFSATLQAIISFVENSGDHIKYVRAGNHQVVFIMKGPIYLVCISCTKERYEALKRQLELLYGQMLLILTKSVSRCFEKNPKFDMTPLLSGTDAVFSSLIHSFSWNPATFLHAYTCLPISFATRQAAGAILQDVADSVVLFALLMCKHKVVSLVGAQKASLHPDDMLLLSNFITASESYRTSEAFSPICLPRYNPMVFLYAYVGFLNVDTYLILLTTRPDYFYHLKDCRIRIESVLVKSNVLVEVQRCVLNGGLRVEDVPVVSSLHS